MFEDPSSEKKKEKRINVILIFDVFDIASLRYKNVFEGRKS